MNTENLENNILDERNCDWRECIPIYGYFRYVKNMKNPQSLASEMPDSE